MKTIALLLIIAFLISCEKEKKPKSESEMLLTEGYIIGFDQCVAKGSHVIVTNNYMDTLVAYLMYGENDYINRLDTIYKFPGCYHVFSAGDTVFTFPEYYYTYYLEDFLFPESVRNNYKIFLNYTLIREEEKYPVLCTADIYRYQFNRFVRGRQIKINYATKCPLLSIKIK